MRIEGEGSGVDAAGKRHSMLGIGSLPDDVVWQNLRVSGVLHFDKINAKTIHLEGDSQGNSIASQTASCSGKITADVVAIEKSLNVCGIANIETLRADEFIMESRDGSLGDVNCTAVKIFEGTGGGKAGSFFGKLFGATNSTQVHIKKLKADRVELQNCVAESVECNSALIGSNCVIDKLLVKNNLEVAEDSAVKETIRS